MSRLLALQHRRGITLPALRFDPPTPAIEHADCAVVLGNEFTIGTYSYANKPIYRLPISAPFVYPWPQRKDFEASRRNFLWFGSHGFVHKGLDLVLEAFAEMPEYHLTVCGPIELDVEKDFKNAFNKELYQTSNICTVGWVDVGSPEFVQIVDQCAALIYPSCSEGQCGGVIVCMHAGLIPILSYESGVDVEGFGFLLQDCSVEGIKNSIRMVASLSAEALRKKARQAWEFARANHTREKFAEEYRKVVGAIISAYRGNANGVPVSTNGVGQTSDRASVYQ
jgi:glycosyltransferase involved in cell wall biosynthesis